MQGKFFLVASVALASLGACTPTTSPAKPDAEVRASMEVYINGRNGITCEEIPGDIPVLDCQTPSGEFGEVKGLQTLGDGSIIRIRSTNGASSQELNDLIAEAYEASK